MTAHAPLDADGGARLLAVFGGEGSEPWARLLKPGFRHCFVLKRLSRSWLLADPRGNGLVLAEWKAHAPARLIAGLEGQGYRVVVVPDRPLAPLALPPGPFTCAEAVKRILGLRRPLIATPWRLYSFLAKNRKKVLDSEKFVG